MKPEDFYAGGLRPRRPSWSQRLAQRIRPANIHGNMTFRAKVWRGLCDWSWGIELGTPRRRRMLWFWRRLFQ